MAQGRALPSLRSGTSQGRGFAGSFARAAIRGPHLDSRGDAGGPSGVSGTQAHGRSYRGGGSGQYPGAESITAESDGAAGPAAGNLRGVSVGYREQAEAYFRRLAEEQ